MTARWLMAVLLAPGLVGCMPSGPSEFYRSALQAKSEFVDSLSRVTDEKSAGENLKSAQKIHDLRIKDVVEELERARLDESYNRLRRENFDLKKVDPDFRARMIDGVRTYAFYCKNVVYTNVRLRREIQRLRMLANLEMLAKARQQIAANQPVSVSMNDCKNLEQLIKSLSATGTRNDLRFFPQGMARVDFDKLQSGIDGAEIDLAVGFDPQNLNVQVPGLEPPPLPSYPAWAIEADTRAKLGLTGVVR